VTALSSAFAEASDDSDMRRSADAVKRVAIDVLQGLDPDVEAHATDFFNHTFAPDLLLRWPRTDRAERPVYLRLHSVAEYLTEDVTHFAERNPVLLNVVDLPDEQTKRQQIDSASRQVDGVVFDPRGLTNLLEGDVADPLNAAIGPALVRAGIGVQGGVESDHLKAAISSGFQAASELSPGPVERARSAIRDALKSEVAEDLDYFLLAMWLASDGRTDQFPGGPLTTGDQLSGDLRAGVADAGRSHQGRAVRVGVPEPDPAG